MCAGMVAGVGKALRLLACPPADVTLSQSVLMVVSYVEKHPELHTDFVGLAMVALIDQWPCQK
jgi:hypothetical protein